MAPVVGITSSPARHRSHALLVERDLLTLDRSYVNSVAAAGGAAVVLPVQPAASAEAVVDRIDALVLSGGGDVAPERYGAARHPAVGGVDTARDEWEVALIAQARRREVPILAICRGMQILNVALGGTLIQHLGEHADAPTTHVTPEHYDAPVHHVQVSTGSCLADVLGTEVVDVNTLHHQAVDRCADDLRIVGRDQDGVVEAVEHPTEPILGVQWHPEMIAHLSPHDRLFDWIVGAGIARQATRTGART